jgi:hypothetical protein
LFSFCHELIQDIGSNKHFSSILYPNGNWFHKIAGLFA